MSGGETRYPDRDEAIVVIRNALKRRSGHAWSVRGGRGTAWGWITISSVPRQRVGGTMTDEHRKELARLLGLDYVHQQGLDIPSSGLYRQEYVDRAQGRTPSVIGTPYWD